MKSMRVRLYEYARQLNAKRWDQISASQQLERGGRVDHLDEERHERATQRQAAYCLSTV